MDLTPPKDPFPSPDLANGMNRLSVAQAVIPQLLMNLDPHTAPGLYRNALPPGPREMQKAACPAIPKMAGTSILMDVPASDEPASTTQERCKEPAQN